MQHVVAMDGKVQCRRRTEGEAFSTANGAYPKGLAEEPGHGGGEEEEEECRVANVTWQGLLCH